MIGRFFKTADGAGPTGRVRRLGRIALLLAALVVAGLGIPVSGIIPIKASSGHWQITTWFLQFSKQRSVSTHAAALQAPPLSESWLVLKGAGHYETGCRACHGSPELHHPAIARHMLPPPPYIPETINRWSREELFYIIKHGLKFTGMPAWPALQRDDEVWAVVAFLEALPKLDAVEYHRLVHGEANPSKHVETLARLDVSKVARDDVSSSCGRCHGVDGLGRGSAAFPILAGQRPEYLAASLEAYASGKRHSGIMEPIAAGLTPDQIRELSQYYGTLSPQSSTGQPTESSVERGEEIAMRGVPSREVPACAECHGPGDAPRNPIYPVLTGQHADYLALQLTLFQQKRRGGTAYAHLMHHAAAGLSADQIRDVASYYEKQMTEKRSDEKTDP